MGHDLTVMLSGGDHRSGTAHVVRERNIAGGRPGCVERFRRGDAKKLRQHAREGEAILCCAVLCCATDRVL